MSRVLGTPSPVEFEYWKFGEFVVYQTGNFDLIETITDADGNSTLVSLWGSQDFCRYLRYMYPSWGIMCATNNEPINSDTHPVMPWPTPTTPMAELKRLYADWCTNRGHDYIMAMYAMVQKYNPVENVSEYSERKTTFGKKVDEDIDRPEITYDTNIYGLGSGAGGVDSEVRKTSYSKTEHVDRDASGSDTETYSRHGNIGVKSSQEMIQESIELAKRHIISMALQDFINTYAILL